MLRRVSRWVVLLATGGLLFAAVIVAKGVQAAQAPEKPHPHLKLHSTRRSPTDLEILGVSRAAHSYLTYADLKSLPQVPATLVNDPDFPGLTVHVTGTPLEALGEAIEAPLSLDLIAAFCTDGYRSHFPADYVRSHHPILVLSIEGQTSAIWAKGAHRTDPGPYLVAFDHFVPDFKVLAHADEAQIPTNVIQLRFTTSSLTFGSIAPPAGTPQDPLNAPLNDTPIQQGFTIAKQNCLRCHGTGQTGGTKSNITWSAISSLAKARPDIVGGYILNPKSINPYATMPGWPDYDAPTIAALIAYFQSLPASPPRRATHE